MFIEAASRKLSEDIKCSFRLWKNDIKITPADGGVFDIDIPNKVPFILKYNSMGNPFLEVGNNKVELERDNFFMLSIM